MPRSSAKLAAVRLVLGGVFLASIAVLASSCAVAIGVNGYEDSYQQACEIAARCYGPAYENCAARVALLDTRGDSDAWLQLVASTDCLQSCGALHTCLDVAPLCYGLNSDLPEGATQTCTLSEDCCGFQDGTTVCEDGLCCRAIGASCGDSAECCPNAGTCDDHRCGGATCAQANEPCLNAFQCCSNRCNDAGFCEDLVCPPEGFACDASTDCCNLQCLPDAGGGTRCKHPSCAQVGEPCTKVGDCCDTGGKCYKGADPNATSGVCSPKECTPDNSDCTGNDSGGGSDCCTGYCDPDHNLCGKCVGVGAACSAAVPCCADATCNADTGQCVMK
jgi:hypothetical protein